MEKIKKTKKVRKIKIKKWCQNFDWQNKSWYTISRTKVKWIILSQWWNKVCNLCWQWSKEKVAEKMK